MEEYLIDLNATGAARRAGYSARTADQQGPRLLGNVGVQEAIQAAMDKRSCRTEITADRVLREIGRVAFSDIGQVIDFSGVAFTLKPANEIPEDARRAISSIKVKRYMEGEGEDAKEVEVTEFKYWPKDGALRDLAKHLGLLKDIHEHSGPNGGPMQFIPPAFIQVAGNASD